MLRLTTLTDAIGVDPGSLKMLLVIAASVIACAFIQKNFRRELEHDQYYYLRDICLIASWAICGIWAGSTPVKITIAAGVVAGLIGFCQKVVRGWDMRFCFLVVGFGVALLGPRITFIGRPEGEFFYLPNITSIMALSTLWISFFPILFQEIDEIPGMGGGFLIVSWVLMSAVTAVSSKGLSDALVLSLCGLALILVFWSRHVNVYRRLGTPLSAMWGTMLAGTSMLGASKGVAFATVMILPLGLFAIPIIETSLSVLSAAFSPKPLGNMMLYRKIVSRGVEHPTAVFIVTALSALCGISVAAMQTGMMDGLSLVAAIVLFALGVYVAYAAKRGGPEPLNKRAKLWGISVDNFSLDYALGRVSGWIAADGPGQMIVTPDALASLMSRRDRRYAKIVSDAGLVVPDGAGLLWALRFLGFPMIERIPGVELVDHLCRLAAGHGWPVYFFGGKPGVAERAAAKLREKYGELIVAGARDGYFKADESENITREIAASGARIVFVALGVPKQEYWIADNLDHLRGMVAIGIGGSFDVISGDLKRAPLRWRQMKLEWLYRTIQEPYRWRRVIKLPLFVLLVVMKKIHLDTWIDPQ